MKQYIQRDWRAGVTRILVATSAWGMGKTHIISLPMPQQHRNYPPLLPRTALLGPLHPYPITWREELANRLQARGIEISRAFLTLCNFSLLEYASIEDRNHTQRAFRDSTERQITTLSQSLSLALRECRLSNSQPVTETCVGSLSAQGFGWFC